ncbi:MAG: putative capsular polysaccharide synthesis family protein, partial [Verrucomicrobiota bacterium]
HPDREVRLITLVRDPVSRAVSNLFENPNLLPEETDLRELPVEEVVALAASLVESSDTYTEDWFDTELSGVLGFDVFEEPFDKADGFVIVRKGRFSLLMGKLELLANNGGRYLGEVLNLESDLEIPRRRSRSATDEASLYNQVRESLRLPSELLDQVYSSRVCQYFYTPEEIAGFRANWE